MCHTVNEDRDWQCQRCHYEFGQPVERTRELLRDQRTNAKIAFGFLLVIDVAMLALPAIALYAGSRMVIMPGILTVIFLTRATVKTFQKISISNASLRALADHGKPTELPKATLRSG